MFDDRKQRAAVYVRVSSEKQAGEGKKSLEHQQTRCEAYCAAMDYECVEVFVDVETGTAADREHFLRLQAKVKAGHFDVVVAYQVDRLGRDSTDLHTFYKDVLQENACEVAIVAAGINTATSEGRLMYRLMAAFAEFDRDKIVERTSRGKRDSARRTPTLEKGNGWGGQAPFGYAWVGNNTGKLRLVEEEANAVRLVFQMRAGGAELASIAAVLNSQGVCTKTGLPWKVARVGAVLRNRNLYEGRGKVVTGEDAVLDAPAIL